jgi:hypothetical protein
MVITAAVIDGDTGRGLASRKKMEVVYDKMLRHDLLAT